MWQCYNSQYLGKDEIFGWLPELAQKYLSTLALLSFDSFPASHQESAEAFALFACISQLNQRQKYAPTPATWSLYSSSNHSKSFQEPVCLPSSPSSSKHNLFWAAAIPFSPYCYRVTMTPLSMVAAVARVSAFFYAPLLFLAPALQSKVQWWGFHLSMRVSLGFQPVLALFCSHHSGLDSKALAYLLQTYSSAVLQLKNWSNLESKLAIT